MKTFRFWQLTLAVLVLGCAMGRGETPPLWQDDFAANGLGSWIVAHSGKVNANAAIDPNHPGAGGASLRLDSRSELAPNVYLGLSSKKSFAVKGGDEVVLHVQAAGQNAGHSFIAIRFLPSGGESRIYLPKGTFDWKPLVYSFSVPPQATTATVAIGLESKTDALWINGLTVTPSPTPRSSLTAHWQTRPHDRVFPQAGPPASTLLALNVARLDPDTMMFVVTLQGLVNRQQPRIYLFYDQNDRFWADWLVKKKYVTEIRELPDVAALIKAFSSEIKGVVTYDPKLPASRHAAVMLGSIQGFPATGAAMAKKLGIPVAVDLTGRWKRNVDAYRELWTKYRSQFESHVLAVHYPLMTRQGPRDYFVQQRIFTFWVSSYADSEPGGDPAAEMDFAHEVLADTPPNIPIMGWWSFSDTHGIPEYDAVRLSSSYGKFLSGSEFCTNLSVLSGIKVPAEVFRQAAHKPGANAAPKLDPAKLYGTLTVIDSGDSQWYWQQYQGKLWQDPARGRVPINWSLNPTVSDVMPPVLGWFYEQSTPKDLLYCAISGLGYMNSRVYGSRFRPEDRDRVWKEYAAELDRYMKELDLDMLGLYAGSWGEPHGGMDEIYGRFFQGAPAIRGILSDFGRHNDTSPANAIEVVDGKPVFHTLMRWRTWMNSDEVSSQLTQEQLSVDFTKKEFIDNAPKERPALMGGLILSWTMRPGLVEQVAKGLPPDVVLVDGDQLTDLWQQIEARKK